MCFALSKPPEHTDIATIEPRALVRRRWDPFRTLALGKQLERPNTTQNRADEAQNRYQICVPPPAVHFSRTHAKSR